MLSRRRFLAHTGLAALCAPLATRVAQSQDLPAPPTDNSSGVALGYDEDVSKVDRPALEADDPLLPLWCATALPLADTVSFQGTFDEAAASVDTIVVGAGVTGLSTALHLAERGATVLVLERESPGVGTTGRSNGQVIAGLQQSPSEIVAAYGDRCGERVVEFSGAAADLVFALIRRHGIQCEARRDGWIQATRRSGELRDLEAVTTDWVRRGAPVRMLDRSELARLLGTSVYAGGWLDSRSGTIQPLAYARGLAAAAERAGARVVFGVAVDKVVRRGDLWHVTTNRGTARASTVVLATNADTAQLRGIATVCLGHSYLGAYSLQIASEPLDAQRRGVVLPEGHACSDTSKLHVRYFRFDSAGRFVIGGPGWLRPPRSPRSLGFRWLESSTRRMFPALREARFEYRWAARDTLTPDRMPHLYEPAPGLFAANGYNGRGLAIGTALGGVLARRVLGAAPEALPFPTTPLTPIPFSLPAAARFYWRKWWRRR